MEVRCYSGDFSDFLPMTLVTDQLFVIEMPCSPWIWNVETEKCYRKFCDIVHAVEGEKICKKYNGHLVTICSEEENKFVADLGGTLNPTWIGLKRGPSRKYWLWMSGSTCKYRRWARSEPNDITGDEDYSHLWVILPNEYRDWNDSENSRPHDYLSSLPLGHRPAFQNRNGKLIESVTSERGSPVRNSSVEEQTMDTEFYRQHSIPRHNLTCCPQHSQK
ncbi:unnamed protein product [Haemonchus placei]|uniref:C-type lectin domain-containing protein n=1 Tax=Haemonchus placei TaxID=6290 RepID=A0A158QMS5_HAEPC|nr:unnamed protein product [Haemonchus placei]